jgi:carbonic anhydrase/acetyltransferase-like protein (isoleucine patch superfamily)
VRAIQDFFVAANAIVTGDVVLGPGANVWFGCVLRGDLSRITLAARANLQDGCIIHTDHGCPQTLEEGVVVGHRAVLHGARIGRDSLIGMGSVLLSGCEIGERCIVAAGTLVTERKRIPPQSVVMGVPGRVVREATDDEVRHTQEICAHYFEMARRYARGEFPAPWEGRDPSRSSH